MNGAREPFAGIARFQGCVGFISLSRASPARPDLISASSRLALASKSGTCQICNAAEVHTWTLLGQVVDLQAAGRTEQQAAASSSIPTAG